MAGFPQRFWSALVGCVWWLAAAGNAAAADRYVEGEAIVTYRPTATLGDARTSAARGGARLAHSFSWLSSRTKRVTGVVKSDTESTKALIARLQQDPQVLVAEPNYIRRVAEISAPNDAAFGKLWGLQNSGQSANGTLGTPGSDIGFLRAWSFARPPNGEIVVAVMDTGLDPGHPDIVANLWINPGEVPSNGIDDDGNGRIDDVHGYNFAEMDANIADSGDHGTHISGTIAATGHNGVGIIGAAYPVRVMTLKVSDNGGDITNAAEIAAFEYAAQQKARGVNVVAINASFAGGSFHFAERAAIAAVGDVGIVVCVAAGNESSDNDAAPTFPANYRLPNMIVVAASTQNDQLAGFSNRGATTVDLAAPGENIDSLKPRWLGNPVPALTADGISYVTSGFLYAGITDGVTGLLVNCGTGNSAAEFPAAVAGNIALMQRGTATFAEKVSNAMAAGAVAAIVYDNAPGPLATGTLGKAAAWIPAVFVSQMDGNGLLALAGSPATVANIGSPAGMYGYRNGTSMATPHVTAAVALAARNFPAETPTQRVARIINHTAPVAALTGMVRTGGRLDMLRTVDTDADGLPDWWEIERLGSLAFDATADPDGDGQTNAQEFFAGTNPTDAADRLVVEEFSAIASGGYELNFVSISGVMYQLETSFDMQPGSWVPLGGQVEGAGSIMQFTDVPSPAPLRRFYRIRVIPRIPLH